MKPTCINAVEILRQGHQGYSIKPFIVRADDGGTYFVKGFSKAGGPALISEVIGAELGVQLGLPVPPWALMHISEDLISFSPIANVQDLRGGTAFASRAVEMASDFSLSNVNRTPIDLRRRLFLFDWWIRNEDRNLGPLGGNVNLLLDADGALNVIDHNLAFDGSFNSETFMNGHVFRDCRPYFRDYVVRQEHEQILNDALNNWGTIIDLLPLDWLYRDADHIDETEPTIADRLQMLEGFREEPFWGAL